MEQTNGGSLKAADVESGGNDSVDDDVRDPTVAEKGTKCTKTIDYLHITKDMGQLVAKASQEGKVTQDSVIAGDSSGDPAENETELECTETLDHNILGNNGMECAEPTIGFERKSCDEDVPQEIAVVGAVKFQEESVFTGEENSRLVIVPFIQTEVEQSDFYITGEVMDGMKRETRSYTVYKGGSSSGSLVNVEGEQFIDVPLEVEPLEAHLDCLEGKVCEW